MAKIFIFTFKLQLRKELEEQQVQHRNHLKSKEVEKEELLKKVQEEIAVYRVSTNLSYVLSYANLK